MPLKWSQSCGLFAVLVTLCTGVQAADTPPELLQIPPANPPASVAFPVVPEPGKANTATLFPRYEPLMPAVSFWTRVFSEFSELESVIHSSAHPHKILRVLDFRAQASRMSEEQLSKYRRKAESDAKEQMEDLLAQIDKKRQNPEAMNAEERRIFALLKDVKDDHLFAGLRGTIRSQRGLRERTEKALRVSDRYLPYMEKVFHGYNMPAQLTRLPLVESSFNLDAYSKAGAAGIWQFIPSSARIYMRLNEVVDDRRDPWTSTDAAARHLRDDYAMLGDWPLAITAYNHGRGGISRGLKQVQGKTLLDLIDRYDSKRFGFAGKNYYAEFLAAVDVERAARQKQNEAALAPLQFEVVETQHYVPYETLRRLCGADDELFRRLNPAYRPEVISGKLYVPPGHLIRIPAGSARSFEVGYARLGSNDRFEQQRVFYLLHKVGRGETLGKLARDYRTSTKQIQQANGLRSTNIRIGQVLKIPPHEESRPGPITVAVGESKPSLTREERKEALRESEGPATYIVRSGDTLGAIARRYSVSVTALRNSNQLSSSTIKIGQRLTIPGRGAAAFRTHTVRNGQTLSSIARSYDISVADLRGANDLGKSSLIRVGQKLRVPTR